MSKSRDLTGQTFGRLTALSPARTAPTRKAPRGEPAWSCRCACGGSVVVLARALRGGYTRSCGCLKRESVAGRNRRHGHYDTPEYHSWRSMLARCGRPGGPPIPCAPEFRSFEVFLSCVGPRPSERHVLGRADRGAGFAAGNVRWEDRGQNVEARYESHRITFRGRSMTISAWSRELGIRRDTLRSRIHAKGWPVERAFTTPVQGRGPRRGGPLAREECVGRD